MLGEEFLDFRLDLLVLHDFRADPSFDRQLHGVQWETADGVFGQCANRGVITS